MTHFTHLHHLCTMYNPNRLWKFVYSDSICTVFNTVQLTYRLKFEVRNNYKKTIKRFYVNLMNNWTMKYVTVHCCWVKQLLSWSNDESDDIKLKSGISLSDTMYKKTFANIYNVHKYICYLCKHSYNIRNHDPDGKIMFTKFSHSAIKRLIN